MDLKITDDNDLAIEGGDLVLVRDQEAIAQAIKMRLQHFLGESPYDKNGGTPWIQVIFEPSTPINAVRFVLQRRILGTPGVTGAVVELTPNPETRVVTGVARATTIEGDVEFSLELTPEGAQIQIGGV